MAEDDAKCGAITGIIEILRMYEALRDRLDAANVDYLELNDKYRDLCDSYQRQAERMRRLSADFPMTPDDLEALVEKAQDLEAQLKAYKEAAVLVDTLPNDLILYRVTYGAGPALYERTGTMNHESHVRRIAQRADVAEVIYYKAVGRIRNPLGGDQIGEYERIE